MFQERRSTWCWLAAALLVAVFVGLAWYLRSPAVATANDDAAYLLLARALQHGSYHDFYLLGSPPHSQYPPGFPLLIALTGGAVGAVEAMNIALAALGLLLLYDVVRRRWSPEIGLLVLLPLALNPLLTGIAGWPMSEASFFGVTMAVLWAATVRPDSARLALLAGVGAIFAALTRSIGVTLVAALGLCWLLERRWRRVAGLALGAAVVLGGWFAYTVASATTETGGSYVADARAPGDLGGGVLLMLFERLRNSIPDYLSRSIPWYLPLPTVPGTPIDNLIWFVVVVAGLATGLVVLWRRWRLAALYLLAYGGLLAIWPYVVGRFLIPILPLLILALTAWSWDTWRRQGSRLALATGAGLCLVMAGEGLHRDVFALRQAARCDRTAPFDGPGCYNGDQRSFAAAARYISDSLPADDVILTPKGASLSYLTGHRTAYAWAFLDGDGGLATDRLRQAGVHYLLLGRTHWTEQSELGPALLAVCDQLELVRSFPPETHLLRLTQPGRPSGLGSCPALERYQRDSNRLPLLLWW